MRNNQDQQLVFYDSLGRRVTAIGRAGKGPGEFTGLRRGWVYLVAQDADDVPSVEIYRLRTR